MEQIPFSLGNGRSKISSEAEKPITVSQLTQQIKNTLEPAFTHVWVQGEISNFRPAASGHLYFSLKDEGSMIAAAAFGFAPKLKNRGLKLEDGMKVECKGKLSIYGPRGTYQLLVDSIEPQGLGALYVAFEELKSKLQKEGLFDPARKRKLPRYPKWISVVTSPSGAAIQDMLNVFRRRSPMIRITVIPAVVQGADAAASIRRGLKTANDLGLGEVVVLARGGGAFEEMACFNDEALVREIAASKIPTISAVGHEIDFMISDFVADVRSPTPTAAAEILSYHWAELKTNVEQLESRLKLTYQRKVSLSKQLLHALSMRLQSPQDKLHLRMQRIDELFMRMTKVMQFKLERSEMKISKFHRELETLSPLAVLERGFLIATDVKTSTVISNVKGIRPGQELELRWSDGRATVEVHSKSEL